MKKLIEIEFYDDFTPPNEFSQRSGSQCERCPFYRFYDDDYPTCGLQEWNEIYRRTIINDCACPIKKYFDAIDKEK